MTEIKVIVTGPEEAYDYEAEFWRGNELIGVTVLHEGRLHLRIDPRPDGSPVAGGCRQPGALPGRGRATARRVLRRAP
jgi:hypothetical protein